LLLEFLDRNFSVSMRNFRNTMVVYVNRLSF